MRAAVDISLADEASLVEHLISLLELATSAASREFEESMLLAGDILCCLLHASLQDATFWAAFSNRQDFSEHLGQLVLSDPRIRVRQMSVEIITNLYQINTRYSSVLSL